MQGAIARTPRSIAVVTTGAANSTSHVTNRTAAFWLSSRSAQALATSALLPCVSQVSVCSFLPLTPPFALILFASSLAAASAGPSNGAMSPDPSNAQPMMIGGFALRPLFAASALLIRASASTAAAATANLPRPLIYSSSWVAPATGLHGTGRYLVNLGSVSRVPGALERLFGLPCQLVGRHVPERVRPRIAERAVVGKDLDVVEPVPPGRLQRAEQCRQVGRTISREHAIAPCACRLAPVGNV